MKLQELRPGHVVWRLTTILAGNSNRIRREKKERIRITAVSYLEGYVEASIDGDRIRRYTASDVAKWQRQEPLCAGWHSDGSRRSRKGQRILVG